MMTFVFILLFVSVFGKLTRLAFRATWGIAKVATRIIFLPLFLASLAFAGFLQAALVLLMIVGLVSLTATAA